VARSSIGVDIGSSGVRAVQVNSSNGKFKIIHAGEVPLSRGTIVGGEVRDSDELTEALKELWKTGKFSSRNVTVGLMSEKTINKNMRLPWEPAEIFRTTLPLRMGNAFPYKPEEMTVDYHPLDHTQIGDLVQQNILIVAAHNAAAENTIGSFTSAKLRVKCADYSPLALIRAAVVTGNKGSKPSKKPRPESAEKTCEVLVDVGSQMTMVAIHDHGRPLFIRQITTNGGEAIDRALLDMLKVRMEVAEALKKSLGTERIEETDIDLTALLTQVKPEHIPQARQIVTLVASALVQEVRKTVDYYLSRVVDPPEVSRVLLSGGGVLTSGYADRISSELRAPTAFLAPMHAFANKKTRTLASLDPRMTLAFGLALGVE
jgi:type IV pilus assembly protein PilM